MPHGPSRVLLIAAVTIFWIPLVLLADGSASIELQRALGVATWLLLIGLLWGESRAVRIQVGAVIVAATLLEYSASPLLGLYTYRLHNVPSFVPPGHGLVYLAALTAAGAMRTNRAGVWFPRLVLVVAAGWALWGITLSSRPDTGGALLFLFLAAFILRGRAPLVYAAAFVVTAYLEIIGTHVGNWAWAGHDFVGVTTLGNPPSGIAGGYCFLDMVGIYVAIRLADVHAPALHVEPAVEPVAATAGSK
ncbi:MAG: hypothetical protein QOG02_608 [Gaiellales bacterium]|nr:hypothetical protein [Gaiellales bacterium]